MRVAAILLLVLCLAAVGLTGYLYLNANVTILGVECVAADAADQAGLFQNLKAQMEDGTFVGTPFETEGLGDAEDYQFYTYTVRLRNATFVKAEVAEVQVTPMKGDVLQMPENGPAGVSIRSDGSVSATILTSKEMHNVRELTVSYYLWGLPFMTRTTYNR